MIPQLKKTCTEVVDRIHNKIAQIQSKHYSSLPKNIKQILNSISNDTSLLKDQFALIITKVSRLQTKCFKNQHHLTRIEGQYRAKYDEISQNYKLLQAKHQKIGKQLNFVKYSNKNLRSELIQHSTCSTEIKRLNSALSEIRSLIANNSENLASRVNEIVSSIKIQKQPLRIVYDLDLKDNINVDENNRQDQIFKDKISYSCEIRKKNNDIHINKTQKKPNKQAYDVKDPQVTTKKNRLELARLVEQQSRLAKIHERYMSTNIV